MPDDPDRLDRMLHLVRHHRPGVRLVDRNTVPWMKLPGDLIKPVVGDLNQRFTTVLGNTVYLPGPVERFDRDRLAAILAHELVHQLDQRRVGSWFYVSYVLLAPAGRTRRAHWERRAYAVDLLLAFEMGGEPAVQATLERLVPIFAGASYAFMWVGAQAARDYLQPVVDTVLDGSLAERFPYRDILAAWRGTVPSPELPEVA